MNSTVIQIDDVQWKELDDLSGNSMGIYEFFKDQAKTHPKLSTIVMFIENNLACHDGILFDSWSAYVNINFTRTDNVAIMHLDFDAKELKVERLTAYKRWWKNVENTCPGILFHIIKHAQRADVEGKSTKSSGSSIAFSAAINDKFKALRDKSKVVKANMSVDDKVKMLKIKRDAVVASKPNNSIGDDVDTPKKIQALKNKRDLVNSGIPIRVLNLKRKRNKKFIKDIHG